MILDFFRMRRPPADTAGIRTETAGAKYVLPYPDPELTFTTKMADIPLAIQEQIFGNQIDDNGVLIRTSTDKPPYFAVGLKAKSQTASTAMCGCTRCGQNP